MECANQLQLLIITLIFLGGILCTPLRSEQLSQLAARSNDVQESRQFIGSSVIGGLMWPILLTLAMTGIMARIPDALQRLLTRRPSGSALQSSYRSKLSDYQHIRLEEVLQLLEKSHVFMKKMQ